MRKEYWSFSSPDDPPIVKKSWLWRTDAQGSQNIEDGLEYTDADVILEVVKYNVPDITESWSAHSPKEPGYPTGREYNIVLVKKAENPEYTEITARRAT